MTCVKSDRNFHNMQIGYHGFEAKKGINILRCRMLQHEHSLHFGSRELTGYLDSGLARGAYGNGDERIYLKVCNGAERYPDNPITRKEAAG